MNGSSTGCLPIHVRNRKMVVRHQKSLCETGRKVLAWLFDVWRIGTMNKMRIDANKAITPPNFLGMDRRIA